MTAGKANAAIWFTSDGYDPAARGINGRRVAGESFLRGFFNHAEVEEFVGLTYVPSEEKVFRAFAQGCAVTKPLRCARLDAPQAIAPVDVIYYAAPNFAGECWRRAPYGATAWAISGITHTTATKAILQGIFDLRSAPQMPWDAIACTSRAVQSSLHHLMDLAETHLARRFFGAVLPARPLTPVIPLGIHSADFLPDPDAGQALRQKLGIAPEDIALACIARLIPEEKFDPLPLFIALEAAQEDLRSSGAGRLHLILCGQFGHDVGRAIFDDGAAALMPSVGYHTLDGADADQRKATLSGSDIFVFPIDNVQETFGLAPIEAMAAGLPVIVSDWDGMKDTVTPDTGIRIPTEMGDTNLTLGLAMRHYGGTDSYRQYLSQLSALTRIDVGALRAAVVTLARDPDLRARMGAAAQARARALYDWRAVIPQMQALWGEQQAMLHHARGAPAHLIHARVNPAHLPVAPSPSQLFASYPSARQETVPHQRYRSRIIAGRPGPNDAFDLRNYAATRRLFEDPVRIRVVAQALDLAGPSGASLGDLAKTTTVPLRSVQAIMLWLMKYHFAEEC